MLGCFSTVRSLWRIVLTSIALTFVAPLANAQHLGESAAQQEKGNDQESGSPSKQQCLDSHAESQKSRYEADLVSALDGLRICAHGACPEMIRTDCTEWLLDVQQAMPTFVLRPQVNGKDVEGVVLTVDDEVVESVRGQGNPGIHVVRAERKGHEPVTVNFELRQGEKNRTILIEIAPAEGTAEERKVKRPVPLPTWISAGIAVAGAAVGTGFYIAAASERKDLERSCAPLCTDEETKGLRLKGMGADIGAGVAVVSGITALVFYLARPSVPRNEEKLEAKKGVRWDVAVSHRGGALTLRGVL